MFMSNWNFIFLFCFIAYWSQALLWSLGKRKRLLFLQAPGCWVTLPNSWTRGSSGKHSSRACGSSFFLSSIPLGLSSVCLDWFSLATNFTSQLQELFSKSQCTRPLFSFPCCSKNNILLWKLFVFESDVCFHGTTTQIVVAVKKILYATDANESALEDAQEYLNQSLGVKAEVEENGEQEDY